MDQPPETTAPTTVGAAARYNRRLGLALFALYSGAYALFMVLCAFYPEVIESSTAGGVNLAVAYGFGLIFGAFALAVVYLLLAKRGDGA